MRTTIFFATALACSSIAAAADTATKQPDQTFVLEGLPTAVPIPKVLSTAQGMRAPTGLSSKEIASLTTELVKLAGGERVDSRTYYILHLVRYKNGAPDTREDAWYTHYAGWVAPSARQKLNDPEVPDHYKQARLFGARKLSFLYLHYGVPAGPVTLDAATQSVASRWNALVPSATQDAVNVAQLVMVRDQLQKQDDQVVFKIKNDAATVASKYAEALQELKEQIPLYATRTSANAIAEFRVSGGRIVGPRQKDLKPLSLNPGPDTAYVESDFLPITYEIDITKKQTILEQDLNAVLGQFGLQAAAETIAVKLPLQALLAARLDMQVNYPTSDIVITGVRGTSSDTGNQAKLIATKKYDNERRYPVDFGFALPLKSVSELTYSSSTGVVQPKPQEKNRFYGTVDFFPLGPVDTKSNSIFRLAPELIYGMALNDTPWNHHLFAFGLGLKWAQPFAGVTATRNVIPSTTNTVAGYKWHWQFAYGVQIPASAITNLIKSATK